MVLYSSTCQHSIPLACNEINSSDVDDSVALKLETEITTIDDIPPPNRLEIIDVQESRINVSYSSYVSKKLYKY